MRKNEYDTLDEFCREYDEVDYKNQRGFMGIEFTYRDVYYRMCREPIPETDRPILSNGKRGRYRVVIVHWKDGWFSDFEYELIGWYEDINDLLDNCRLGDMKFKDVIMADETEIIGKD